ncbi:50S ribosomal protein L14e [Candidatus Woesearchaeota archaeon]|nr:50S ribosomal protein L14e [Candidatus Woesearchaeota archaeon]
MTIGIGRLVVKTAGRDASKKGVIIDILYDKFVLIDGETRRRKVNILHIEPLNQIVKIEKNASHEDVSKALDELGLKARATKPKLKTEKPRKKRKTPEQLRVQKEEKRKLRDFFKFKKKEEKSEDKKEATLEEKAGLKIEEVKEESKEASGSTLVIAPVEEGIKAMVKETGTEQRETKEKPEKEVKQKDEKTATKKTTPKKKE